MCITSGVWSESTDHAMVNGYYSWTKNKNLSRVSIIAFFLPEHAQWTGGTCQLNLAVLYTDPSMK